MFRYIRWRYLVSLVRVLTLAIFSCGRIKINSIFLYIGKDVKIRAKNKIVIGQRCYFRDRVSIISFDKGLITIGKNTFVNENSLIVSREEISIGSNCLIADNVSIYDHDHRFSDKAKLIREQGYVSEKVSIGNNVLICSHVVVCKGVVIQDNSVIAAGSVVLSSVPSNCLYGGVPAKFIKSI